MGRRGARPRRPEARLRGGVRRVSAASVVLVVLLAGSADAAVDAAGTASSSASVDSLMFGPREDERQTKGSAQDQVRPEELLQLDGWSEQQAFRGTSWAKQRQGSGSLQPGPAAGAPTASAPTPAPEAAERFAERTPSSGYVMRPPTAAAQANAAAAAAGGAASEDEHARVVRLEAENARLRDVVVKQTLQLQRQPPAPGEARGSPRAPSAVGMRFEQVLNPRLAAPAAPAALPGAGKPLVPAGGAPPPTPRQAQPAPQPVFLQQAQPAPQPVFLQQAQPAPQPVFFQQAQPAPQAQPLPQAQSLLQQAQPLPQAQQQPGSDPFAAFRFQQTTAQTTARQTVAQGARATGDDSTGYSVVMHPNDPYFQALGQANMAQAGMGYHPMNSPLNPLYGPGGGAATPQALSSQPTIRGTMAYASQYPGYNPAAVQVPGAASSAAAAPLATQLMDKSPGAAALSYGLPGNVRLPPVPPPVPPRPSMGTPPPPISQVIDTPDVLPAPVPPVAPQDAKFGARRFPTQYDAGVGLPPGTEPRTSQSGGAMSVQMMYPGEAPVQATPAQPLSRAATMRADQHPNPTAPW
jgi:hypothetical protein